MRATVLTVYFIDGSWRDFPIGPAHPWRIDRATQSLVIGHGIPRVHVPVSSMLCWELG